MPTGIEFMFAFTKDRWRIVEEAWKVKFPTIEEIYETGEWSFDTGEVEKELKKAHKLACEDMGFELLKNGRYPEYKTPEGPREMVPFNLELVYDGEMDYAPKDHVRKPKPLDVVFGVAISGRYFPTFLDWRSPFGTLTNVIVGPKPTAEVSIAWRRIVEAVPVFSSAEWLIVEKSY